MNVLSSGKDVRTIASEGAVLRCAFVLAGPTVEGSEAETEPPFATLAVSVAGEAEIEVALVALAAVVVEFALDVWFVAAVASN